MHDDSESLFLENFKYYDSLKSNLIYIKELLENQSQFIKISDISILKEIIVKSFKKQPKFIRETFLNNSENRPFFVEKVNGLISENEVNGQLVNNLKVFKGDSLQLQVDRLKTLAKPCFYKFESECKSDIF